jgi:hypothetical protein
VRRITGQAARHGGRLLHALVQLALALVIFVGAGLGVLAWRLSEGPLELAWLTQRLTAAVNAEGGVQIALGGAALAWEGFRRGGEPPLDIRLTGLTVSDATTGRTIATVPRAAVLLAVSGLLRGRIEPRSIEVDGARLHVVRAPDGSIGFDLSGSARPPAEAPPTPSLPTLLARLTEPSASSRSRWAKVRRVHIRDAAVSVVDHRLGVTWQVPALHIDLTRQPAGGIAGEAAATLALGNLSAQLQLSAHLAAGARDSEIEASLSPINPARLAAALPAGFAGVDPVALGALAAPIRLSATAQLGSALELRHATLAAEIGAGTVRLGMSTVPIVGASLFVEGAPDKLHAELRRLVAAPWPDGPTSTLTGHADAAHAGGGWEIAASLDLDHARFADLPALWPAGVGGPGTRPWITQNITDGIARNGHLEVALTVPDDFSDATLTRLAGGIDGTGLTVHWLRPVPPITGGEARLNFLSPDRAEVLVTAGQQGGIVIRGGRVAFSGLTAKDQSADIDGDLAGTVADLLALLRQPRIKLLDRSPLPVRDAAGKFSGHIAVAGLPLRDSVNMDDLQIRTEMRLTGLGLPAIAAGQNLTNGTFDLRADPEGLHAAGDATVGDIPAKLALDMDFRAGPPSQVQESISASATIGAAQLTAMGLHTAPFLSGPTDFQARVALRRDNRGEATINADLARATLSVAELNWAKPAGQPASAEAHLLLDGERIAGIDRAQASGSGLTLAGRATFADGRAQRVELDRLVLGTGTDARGTLVVPQRPVDPWRITLTGRSLDASTQFKREPRPAAPPKPAPPGPPYVLDARFDRVIAGNGRDLTGVSAQVDSDGQVMRRLAVAGQTSGAQPFNLTIEPQPGGRRLVGNSSDAGGLLLALGVIESMQGGQLRLVGDYDDTQADHPLTGRAEIDNFRIVNAPFLGRALQAMTLYGVVGMLQGPGLGFRKLEAPFRLSSDVLELLESRAFSASLGMTAKGKLDLARHTLDIQGTIVPAYFFNSLLGDIPLIGRLFSPERGSGLFAATYTARGPLSDPTVSVNPLAALTPGFLRGLFHLFDRPASAK